MPMTVNPMPEPPSGSRAAAPSASKGRTLLVVDDDAGVREALAILLGAEYNLLLAENGRAALETVRDRAIDVVVLDIRMPGLSGIETLRELKRIDPVVEVIILTAFETMETAREALRLGACDYLSKPYDIHLMRQSVANAMDRRSISNEIQTHDKRLVELQEQIQDQQLREELARTRTDIYASILHDVNGPLTIISGVTEMLQQEMSDATRIEGRKLDAVRHHLAMVSRQVHNCLQISRRYLGFLQGRSNPSTQIGINQIFADVESLLQVHPSARENELVIRPLARDVSPRIDSTDLIQILLNLTINALQASPSAHGVKLEAELLQIAPVLKSDLSQHQRLINPLAFVYAGPFLAITVRDNGPGIPSHILPRLFEPYFTTKPAGQGTGLGLSIVRRLVEQAKGAIHIRSVPSQGATFAIYLPV